MFVTILGIIIITQLSHHLSGVTLTQRLETSCDTCSEPSLSTKIGSHQLVQRTTASIYIYRVVQSDNEACSCLLNTLLTFLQDGLWTPSMQLLIKTLRYDYIQTHCSNPSDSEMNQTSNETTIDGLTCCNYSVKLCNNANDSLDWMWYFEVVFFFSHACHEP